MKNIGIRELKTHASAIVQAVREEHERYVVTYRGRPVGLLCPLDDAPRPAEPEAAAAWNTLFKVGDRIGKRWRSRKTGAQIVSEMRR